MPTDLTPEDIDKLARRRANSMMGWYTHAAIFTLINLYWYLSSEYGFGHHGWSPKMLFGWGLGLVLHGFSVFVLGRGSSLRESLVRRERERLLREQNRQP